MSNEVGIYVLALLLNFENKCTNMISQNDAIPRCQRGHVIDLSPMYREHDIGPSQALAMSTVVKPSFS